MRWNILALLFCLTISSICWGQYTTSYVWGVSDLSGRMNNTNLWYPLKNKSNNAQGICNGVPTMGSDMIPVCTGNGTPTPSSANGIWYFDTTAFLWKQITAVGTGWYGVASININNLYLLKPSSACTSWGGYGTFHWDGTTLTQLASSCLTEIQAGDDGSLFAVDTAHTPNQIFFRAPGAAGWAYAGNNDQSVGWTYASGANMNDYCGVKNGLIFTYDSDDSDGNPSQFVQMTTQPPASNLVYTCQMANDPNNGLGMFSLYRTTNNHGQYISAFAYYNFSSGTWTPVQMPSRGIMSVTSLGKWPTLAVDTAGYIWHFNVYGVYLYGQTTGTWSNCPTSQCVGSATHTGTIQVNLPQGLYGAKMTVAVAPSGQLMTDSYDVTALGCDALFSDPTACAPSGSGTVICSVSGVDFGGASANPPEPQTHWTEYAGGFDQFFSTIKTYPYTEDGRTGYIAVSLAGYTDNACQPGTYSACAPPYGGDSVTITTACQDIQGHSCTPADAAAKGKYEAKQHAKSLGTVWGAFFNYTQGASASCDRITVYNTKTYTPCF